MEAYVTLVATEAYASGTLVLSHKLRELGSKKEIVCMVTPNISSRVQSILSKVCTVVQVDELRSADFDNLKLLGRLDLDISITKIQLWRLTQYKKLVFLDADTLPMRNIDELFNRPCFSAAPDAGWPDCFNSGVFVTQPSEDTYQGLISLASQKGSFDGGDQGLLNTYFSNWPETPEHRLPFTFNTTPTTQYGYAPAHNEYGRHISIIHFIGENKPWKYQRFADGKVLPLGNTWEGLRDMVQSWWDTWDKFYGQTSPYQLLSGDFDQMFDNGFQTRPIVPFDKTVSNAWDNQDVDLDNERRQVYPMPALSSITIGQPVWLKEETRRREEEERNRKFDEEQYLQQYHQQASQEHQHCKHQSQKDHRNKDDHYHHKQDHQEPKTYAMIEWDPAHQGPPNTGNIGANIPELTSFKNVWDQPSSEKQDRWVAPLYQPEPEIMAKPEYSQYNIDDYEPHHHYPPIHSEFQSTAPTEKEKPHHHHHEEQHHQPEYPPSFPWENVADHFPPPTRIWRQEPQHYEPEYHHRSAEPELFEALQQSSDKSEEHDDSSIVVKQDQANDYQEHHEIHSQHKQRPETFKDAQPSDKDINPLVPQQEEPDQTLFAIDKAVNPSMQNKIEEFIASLNTEDNDISDRDLIPIKFKPTSRLQTGMYTPSPIESPVGSRNSSRRASVSSTRRAGAPSSRRSSTVTTHIPILPKHKLSSDGATTDVVSSSAVKSTTYQGSQNAKLFATASASVFRKTPYTSASVTPALAETPDGYERHDYFYSDDEEVQEDENYENGLAAIDREQNRSDFLYDRHYSLTERLNTETVESTAEWDPLGSLAKLKEHSESMVLRQSLQEALIKTVEEQQQKQQQQQKEQQEHEELSDAIDKKLMEIIKAEEEENQTSMCNDSTLLPTSTKKKRPSAFKSSWDDEEYELPSALASGESTPRTPIARKLPSSDLTKLLALEEERSRQQRASLKMAKPQAAVASMLEAELDLSHGLLPQRRHQLVGKPDNNGNDNDAIHAISLSDASNKVRELLAGEESDTDEKQESDSPHQYVTYYDEHVILEAQKRLSALITGNDVEKEIGSLPLSATETSSMDSHHANFRFDENHTLPTDESMVNSKTLDRKVIPLKNNPIEKQMLAKEEEAGQKLEEERLKMLAEKSVSNVTIDTNKREVTEELVSSASANIKNNTTSDLTQKHVCLTASGIPPEPAAENIQQTINASVNIKKRNILQNTSGSVLDLDNGSSFAYEPVIAKTDTKDATAKIEQSKQTHPTFASGIKVTEETNKAVGKPILAESSQEPFTSESAVSIINPELDTPNMKPSLEMTGETSSMLEPTATSTTELASIPSKLPVITSQSNIDEPRSSVSKSKNLKSESSSSTMTDNSKESIKTKRRESTKSTSEHQIADTQQQQ